MGAFCEKMGDGFRCTAVLAEAILMLAEHILLLLPYSGMDFWEKRVTPYDDERRDSNAG